MAARRVGRKAKPKPALGDMSEADGFAALGYRYLEWMRVRHYSEQTVEERRDSLGRFIRWCEERGLRRPEELTLPIVERYQKHLFYHRKADGRPLTVYAQRCRLGAVKGYCKWLVKQRITLSNPAAEVEMPRSIKRLPKHVLTVSEVEQVLALADVKEPLGVRDRALLETLYSTGMRRMEVIGLQVRDVSSTLGAVMIRNGKGRKDRIVPIGERALEWIERYVHDSRPALVAGRDEGELFLTAQGEPFTRGRMTQLVRGYVMAANLGKTGSCHLFRHSMATQMLEGGADIRHIQEILGHAELSTTQIYTRVSVHRLKKVHAATHPAAAAKAPSKRKRRQQEREEAEQSDYAEQAAKLLKELDAETAADEDDSDSQEHEA